MGRGGVVVLNFDALRLLLVTSGALTELNKWKLRPSNMMHPLKARGSEAQWNCSLTLPFGLFGQIKLHCMSLTCIQETLTYTINNSLNGRGNSIQRK